MNIASILIDFKLFSLVAFIPTFILLPLLLLLLLLSFSSVIVLLLWASGCLSLVSGLQITQSGLWLHAFFHISLFQHHLYPRLSQNSLKTY